MKPNNLKCLILGHKWAYIDVWRGPEEGNLQELYECERCGEPELTEPPAIDGDV